MSFFFYKSEIHNKQNKKHGIDKLWAIKWGEWQVESGCAHFYTQKYKEHQPSNEQKEEKDKIF